MARMNLLTGFNRFSAMILRELKVLPGFIIGGRNLNRRFTDDTMLMTDTKIRPQEQRINSLWVI